MDKFCHQCARSNLEDESKVPCGILGLMLGLSEDHKDYPKELIEDENGPRCTAFIPEGDPIPEQRCELTRELF